MATAKHGSRTRYSQGCRCVACSRSNYRREDRPSDLRWPIRYLLKRFNDELVEDYLKVLDEPQEVSWYREHGLSDFDADKLSCALGEHPMMIWPGWIEAGLEDE